MGRQWDCRWGERMALWCKGCGSGEHVKNGFMRGKQRYRCKACGLNFTDTPPRGMPLRVKLEAVLLYLSGLSMNRTAKLLGVSTPSVQAWIERFAEVYAQKPEPEGRAVVVELDEMWHFLKKLGRQSWLAEELFEPAEVGSGIAAELRPQHPGVPTALEAGAHLAPARPIDTGQIAGVPAAQPGDETGDEPHRAAQHGRRAVGLAAGRPPLVTAVRAE